MTGKMVEETLIEYTRDKEELCEKMVEAGIWAGDVEDCMGAPNKVVHRKAKRHSTHPADRFEVIISDLKRDWGDWARDGGIKNINLVERDIEKARRTLDKIKEKYYDLSQSLEEQKSINRRFRERLRDYEDKGLTTEEAFPPELRK